MNYEVLDDGSLCMWGDIFIAYGGGVLHQLEYMNIENINIFERQSWLSKIQ